MQGIANLFTGFNQSLQVLFNDYIHRNWDRWVQRWSRASAYSPWEMEIADVRDELEKYEEEIELEDLIFIPLGITHHQRERYDIVEYINDITFTYTQTLMERTNGRFSAAYTYGNQRQTFDDLRQNRTFHYMPDGRGSVANLTGSNGAVSTRHTYDPFGVETRIRTHKQPI